MYAGTAWGLDGFRELGFGFCIIGFGFSCSVLDSEDSLLYYGLYQGP